MTNTFLTCDSGAVTVDWVVLTAGLVGIGLATMSVVSTGVEDLSGDTRDQLQANGMITTSFAQSGNRGLYEAYLDYYAAQGTDGVNTDFAAKIAQYENMEDADLITQIQNDVTNLSNAQGYAATLETYTNSDEQWQTMAVWYGADDMTGPEFRDAVSNSLLSDGQTLSDFAAIQTTEINLQVAIGEHAKSIADERGLSY